ncbi:hypothetical protein FRX31_007379, partial [Thalictrum thalictroides]
KNQQWWKHRRQNCARNQVGHGQESVETITHARISAFRVSTRGSTTWSSHITGASATSHVNVTRPMGDDLMI